MTREQHLGRLRSIFTVPRALKAVIFGAVAFAAVTSPYLESPVTDRTPPELAVETSPQTTTLVAVPDLPGIATTTIPGSNGGDPTVVATSTTTTRSGLEPAVRLRDLWRDEISTEYVTYNVGCASDLSAAGLAAFFGQPLGPIQGFDGPRIYALGDGRYLWMLQDTFIDYVGGQTSFAHMNYANSTAMIQDGTCFTALQRGSTTDAQSFEQGDGNITFDRYFWPGGGMVVDGKLQMFWMEMIRDKTTKRSKFDGPDFYPARTWLATYDVATMKRIDFEPAPNDGVFPVYGYHVASEGKWTYLFGNSYLQNLAREGGYGKGPHSAASMFIARVPFGELDAKPQYWNGAGGWDTDVFASKPYSTRFFAENSMLPIPIDGKWVSATKADGFTGSGVVIDVADNPWGPYETVDNILALPRNLDTTDMVTYHALVMPYLDPSGALIVSLSQIPLALGADDAPPKYRPNFWAVEI